MRKLAILCALAVALAGCAVATSVGPASTGEKRVGGKAPSPGPNAGGTRLINGGGGNLVAAGAGNLVAAGAGNLVAAGAGNLVAAGAGNAITSNNGAGLVTSGPGAAAEPPGPLRENGDQLAAGNPLLGAGGASLIGADGGALVVPGGGFLAAAGGLTESEVDNEPGPVISDCEGCEPEPDPSPTPAATPSPIALTLRGAVRAPAALAGVAGGGTLPVAGARVALFDLLGAEEATLTTDAQGAFSLQATVAPGLHVVRAMFTVGGQPVYLSALYATAEAPAAADLGPVSTLFEARFFARLAGKAAADVPPAGAGLLGWHAATQDLAGEVPLDALAPAASLATRAAAWQALAAAHPDRAAFGAFDQYLGTIAP